MPRVPLDGKTFGRLLVISRTENMGRATAYLCRCVCGAEKVVRYQSLAKGQTRSCGCLRKEMMADKQRTHGRYNSPEYRSYRAMLARCSDVKHRQFKDYGARGITVCDRWAKSFENFFSDMGERPPGTTLDRIDNESGYSAKNCRWATRSEQNQNKRNVRVSK